MPAKRITAKCTAQLLLGDPARVSSLFRCQLDTEHEGVHRKTLDHSDAGTIVITWENDMSALDYPDEDEE